MQKVFHIPAPAHLVKFAEKVFWDGHSAPFPVDEGSSIGKQIFCILIDQRRYEAMECDHDDLLEISLSDTLAKRSPDLVKLSRIRLFLQELFNGYLVNWIHAQQAMGNNRYQSVISFLEHYEVYNDKLFDRCYQFAKRAQNIPYRKQKERIQTTNL